MGQRVDTVHNHIVDSLKEAIAAEVSLVSLEEFDAKVEENTYFLKELATLLSEEPDIDFLEHRCEQEVYDYAEYTAKLDFIQKR